MIWFIIYLILMYQVIEEVVNTNIDHIEIIIMVSIMVNAIVLNLADEATIEIMIITTGVDVIQVAASVVINI